MSRSLVAAVVLVLSSSVAFAVKAPKLPATAKKLTGSEIISLYDQTTFRFRNFTGKQIVTGTFYVNFAAKTASGSYVEGKKSGRWSGTVRIKGDQFCRKIGKNREGCVSLFVDGGKIYEVNNRGYVESLNTR
jgi:Protein of unknown function (DUF995)